VSLTWPWTFKFAMIAYFSIMVDSADWKHSGKQRIAV